MQINAAMEKLRVMASKNSPSYIHTLSQYRCSQSSVTRMSPQWPCLHVFCARSSFVISFCNIRYPNLNFQFVEHYLSSSGLDLLILTIIWFFERSMLLYLFSIFDKRWLLCLCVQWGLLSYFWFRVFWICYLEVRALLPIFS